MEAITQNIDKRMQHPWINLNANKMPSKEGLSDPGLDEDAFSDDD
jgi:hypothetical protein